MQNIFAELKSFDQTKLQDVQPVVKQYKPTEEISMHHIVNKPKGAQIESYEGETVSGDANNSVTAEEEYNQDDLLPQEELLPNQVLSPMEELLISLGITVTDVTIYARRLEENGFFGSDELLLDEPNMETLEAIGIDRVEDREKIYYYIHPEEKVSSTKSTDEFSAFLNDPDVDPEVLEVLKLKQEYEALQQIK